LNKPEWLKVSVKDSSRFNSVKSTLKDLKLVTVCEEAHCPNINECWDSGTATFMILGDTCTRGCKFCNVKTSKKGVLVDKNEPHKIAEAVKKWGLDYIVLTSVDRDDLEDQGANHFSKCIKELKKIGILVEVLIPDFRGNKELIKNIIEAKPDVIAHNIETVKSLQTIRDPRASYFQSLEVLKFIKKNSDIYTKSSLMLGFGETEQEIIQTMKDLREIDVDILTLGQYLRPSQRHTEIKEYIHPDQFNKYKELGLELGFLYVASGPFVRSSYKAGELFIKSKCQKK